ncbi:hypothetical protein K4043_08640 [Stenotrophomonas sp. SRS1]|uniref:hypothetical protein n=1 Tax=Stenotrophomonas sp. SRS1 TaxID=2870345 RepID=UPI00223900D1|nr:hypothetical protein [Stenotrophomonas sp. SRS1]MCW6028081.1 hypothetical protein [Stenotrophomonas sp. SRS1]
MVEDYSMVEDMPDFAQWVDANAGAFDFSDYIHAQVVQGRMTTDVLGALVGWLWPQLLEVGGLIVLASEKDKLPLLKSQDLSDGEVEYWCNFTNIDGMLPGVPVSFTGHLAHIVHDMWSAKLQGEFPSKQFKVSVVESRDQNELSVTFQQMR